MLIAYASKNQHLKTLSFSLTKLLEHWLKAKAKKKRKISNDSSSNDSSTSLL